MRPKSDEAQANELRVPLSELQPRVVGHAFCSTTGSLYEEEVPGPMKLAHTSEREWASESRGRIMNDLQTCIMSVDLLQGLEGGWFFRVGDNYVPACFEAYPDEERRGTRTKSKLLIKGPQRLHVHQSSLVNVRRSITSPTIRR
jgi:hypothetical protein